MANPKSPGDDIEDDREAEADESPTMPFIKRPVETPDDDHARIIDARALIRAAGIDLNPPKSVKALDSDLETLLASESLTELPPDIQAQLKHGAEIELIPLNLDGTPHKKIRRPGKIVGPISIEASYLNRIHPNMSLLPQVGKPFLFTALKNGAADYTSVVQRIYVRSGEIFLITKSPRSTQETIYQMLIHKATPAALFEKHKPSLRPLSVEGNSPVGFHDIRPLQKILHHQEDMRKNFPPGTHVMLSKISHEGAVIGSSENKDDTGLISDPDRENDIKKQNDRDLSAVPVVGKKFFIVLEKGGIIQTGMLISVIEEEDGFVLITVNGSEYHLSRFS